MKLIRTKVKRFTPPKERIRNIHKFPKPVFRCMDCREIFKEELMYCDACIKKVTNLQNQKRFQQSLNQ